MSHPENSFVIIRASGEDRRLGSLSRILSGADVPKQFACIAGTGSLLQQAVVRAAGLVPAQRMVVVVSTAYEELARAQLRDWRGIDIIARPVNRGVGLDLLLPLGRVLAQSPKADVVVMPAEHYVPHPEPFLRALSSAVRTLDDVPMVLAGVTGDRRASDHAWIVPGRPLAPRLLSIAGFVEHPSPAHVERLLAAGALRNTSVLVARGAQLWRAIARQLPVHAEAIARLWASGEVSFHGLAAACVHLPEGDLDLTLLRAVKDMAVTSVHGSGWADWDSSEHVIDSLEDHGELELLLSRIFRRQKALRSGTLMGRPELHAHHRHASAA